jgi:hypothetical protein
MHTGGATTDSPAASASHTSPSSCPDPFHVHGSMPIDAASERRNSERLLHENSILKRAVAILVQQKAHAESQLSEGGAVVSQMEDTIQKQQEEIERLSFENAQLLTFAQQLDATVRSNRLFGGLDDGSGFGGDNVAY